MRLPKESTLPCRASHSRTSSGNQCFQAYGEFVRCMVSGMDTMPNHYHEGLEAFLKGDAIPWCRTRQHTFEYGGLKHRIYL